MNIQTAADTVRHLLQAQNEAGHQPLAQNAIVYAPANIALCKYWGKRNLPLNLPQTSSLSISLAGHGTHARISIAEGAHALSINEVEIPADDPAAKRMFAFLDLFSACTGTYFTLTTISTVPVGAGLASSASAFASVVQALDTLFGWGLDFPAQSILARLGSGSASRSIDHGFLEWDRGQRNDGLDSYASYLPVEWPDFRIALVPISDQAKPIGSRDAMNRTVAESRLYQAWPDQVTRDLDLIRDAIEAKDILALGQAAECNAMAMHATMLASRPAILFWLPESVAALHRVWQLRADGIQVFATMDAGPNVKLIFDAKQQNAVEDAFDSIDVIDPFGYIEPDIGPLDDG